MSVGRGMANHKLAVGVYARSLWWTYSKSLEDSESVEKVTFRNLGVEEITNFDSQKTTFRRRFCRRRRSQISGRRYCRRRTEGQGGGLFDILDGAARPSRTQAYLGPVPTAPYFPVIT